MTIRKKVEDIRREEVINKGGEVASDKEKSDITLISFRIPKKLLKEIDEKVKLRPSLSRTAWIIESLMEKIKAE